MRSNARAFEIHGNRERVLQSSPSLRPEQIDTAMRFHEANRELVDAYIKENEAAAYADG